MNGISHLGVCEHGTSADLFKTELASYLLLRQITILCWNFENEIVP